MGNVLNSDQRRHLDNVIQRARSAAELAAADALQALSVANPSRPGYLENDDNVLRLSLREKARQLGDDTARSGADLTGLVRDVAYEQWHRLLFARFLEVNGLLRHPEFRDTALTFDDCADLADDLGEPDGWSVAARFASEILPGVFRLDDPAVQVRFAAERRLELEEILLSIPNEVFITEDALGWVYQFWQTSEDARVRRSGIKIGGADLSPVTQYFTEDYMVRFLLENSLGAWWAGRHPESVLADSWKYLRRLDDGAPVSGSFIEWPARAAEITVMDPCCGSGHFLVAMFGMLWQIRAEEEALSPAEAQDAVLRDNLHGLELDPRCTQIAAFNIALEAWKQGGFRDLPAPKIACSGIPARAAREAWEAHGGDNEELRMVLARLHSLFRNADTLGSLIVPRYADSSDVLFGRDLNTGADWEAVRAALANALTEEDRAQTVLGHAASDVVHAASLLASRYTLIATNPPYLKRASMASRLQAYIDANHPNSRADIATAFIERFFEFVGSGGTLAIVSPQNWLLLTSYSKFREDLLKRRRFDAVARLGSGAFRQISGEIVKVSLSILSSKMAPRSQRIAGQHAQRVKGAEAKAAALRMGEVLWPLQTSQLNNPDMRITLTEMSRENLLVTRAAALQGVTTGDNPRFIRDMWEVPLPHKDFRLIQGSVSNSALYAGRERIIWWQRNGESLRNDPQARIQGSSAWGKSGVAVSQMGLAATLYTGDIFDMNTAIIRPHNDQDLPAIWAYCSSPEFADDVRDIDDALKVTNATLVKVAYDRGRWEKAAEAMGPLPGPYTTDPTQWLFDGCVTASDHPLQVAVIRLLGYRWPAQKQDHLDRFVDSDGIAALQSLPGEPDLATRVRDLLTAAYGDEWSSTVERTLVTEAGGRNGRLEDWLRDTFFAQHVKIFDNRPFLWHVWDGRRDGFAAIANYHRLDHPTLEKLTFTTLGAWIERQKHETAAGRAGADARFAAAEDLQHRLKQILDGAPPYDAYVRWKELHEQPIGWHPDLDDGVRLNIRPFVTAGVLRSRVNAHWKVDRGTNPDGSERVNDLHPTLKERRDAQRLAGVEP